MVVARSWHERCSCRSLSCISLPSQILALILVRRLLDFVFSQHDLAWIDNIIPEKEKKKEDDKKKKKKGNKGDSSSDEEVGEGAPGNGGDIPDRPGRERSH